jgi:hypothetical protein
VAGGMIRASDFGMGKATGRTSTRTTARKPGARKGLRTTNLTAGSRAAGRATRGSAIAGDTGGTKAPRTRAEGRTAATRKRGPSRTRARHTGVEDAMAQLNEAGVTRRAGGRKREIDDVPLAGGRGSRRGTRGQTRVARTRSTR